MIFETVKNILIEKFGEDVIVAEEREQKQPALDRRKAQFSRPN